MLPGVTGSLVPPAFLERWIHDRAAHPSLDHRRALLQWWRRASRLLGPASSGRAVLDIAVLPLLQILGFDVLHLEKHRDAFVGVVGCQDTPVAAIGSLHWDADLSRGWRDVVRAGRITGVDWALICSGNRLRVVDARRTWSRRALDFDFAIGLSDAMSALAVSMLCAAGALRSPTRGGLTSVIEEADRHGVAVCSSLGDGVIDALGALLGELSSAAGRRSRDHAPGVVFEQALTIVYRLLFLLFAEARAAVPTWHRLYRDAYTVGALCTRHRERPRGNGLWSALQAISRLAHAGCRAGDLTVTAFNGRLFSPRHTPLAEQARISNAVVRTTLTALAMTSSHGTTRPIAYADLGVEQLGAVYERVLEYEAVSNDARARAASRAPLVLARTSRERKATGSFYTPRSITEFLVRRALHPLVENRSAEHILQLRVVDPAMGSGAFLVAACRYLAAAVEHAMVDHGESVESSRANHIDIRRLVAQRCLYGVDRNPMAVQLARLSLWLTTLAVDRPLTFLDHHLVCGDSLVGARLHDLVRPPARYQRSDRRQLPLFEHRDAAAFSESLLPDRYRLATEDTDAAGVRRKERLLAAMTSRGTLLARWKCAADIWCGASLGRSRSRRGAEWSDLLAAALDRQPLLPVEQAQPLIDDACRVARHHHALHWDLEFPEVFFDSSGRPRLDRGFDAVIANPPWEVLRADDGEGADAQTRRDRQAEIDFFRSSGVYRQQGGGHPNRYQLFVERALQIAKPGGRLALILPSGIATDRGSSDLRRTLLDQTTVDRLFGFHNAEAIFPIHRDVRFVLLTATASARTDRLVCRFGVTNADWLDTLPDAAADDPPDARPIVLSRALIESFDPEHLSIPDVPTALDLTILGRVTAAVPPLADSSGWAARFGRELNATDDKQHFERDDEGEGRLPVIEGKQLEPYRVAVTSSTSWIRRTTATTLLPERPFARARLGYREVASATNRLTLIAAMLPVDTVSTHTVFCLKTSLARSDQLVLLALLNSLVANYLIRLQVTTHVTASKMARLPVPRPALGSDSYRELVALARSLQHTGIGDLHRYARANAVAAQLYGVTAEEYAHIVSTFPLLSEQVRSRCIGEYVNHGSTEARKHGR